MDLSNNQSLALPVLATVAAVLIVLFYRWTTSATSKIPLPPSDEIVALRVYPVKSCRGFEVKSTKLLRTGLDLDRNWMFINNETREFITIRAHSKMTLLRTKYDPEADMLTISVGDNGKSIEIPAHPTTEWLEENAEMKTAGIWGEQTDAWEYPATLTQPFAEFLDADVRLMYKGPTPRILRGCGAPKLLGRTESIKFADMMPVLVGSLTSLKELNERLMEAGDHEIDIERFRPNIIIRGNQPWQEDSWKALRVNGDKNKLDMDVVCRCLRCQVPNVDPETADDRSKQPWTQLVKYRRIDGGNKYKPSFGMLCAPKAEGLISVGMRFDVTAMTGDHFFINPMK